MSNLLVTGCFFLIRPTMSLIKTILLTSFLVMEKWEKKSCLRSPQWKIIEKIPIPKIDDVCLRRRSDNTCGFLTFNTASRCVCRRDLLLDGPEHWEIHLNQNEIACLKVATINQCTDSECQISLYFDGKVCPTMLFFIIKPYIFHYNRKYTIKL